MNNRPKITVVTGYYNKLENLEESVRSILAQSCVDFEFLIFDDCSTDGTREKLSELAKEDSRIVLIKHEKNLGFVKGLINAIQLAKGEYIAIHGSGDISLVDRLELQSLYLDTHPNIGVVGSYYRNVKDTKLVNVYKNPNTGDLKNIIKKRNVFSHGEVMYRKSIYQQVGGYREFFIYAQDRDLWCRFSTLTNYFVIEKILYERRHDDPESVNNNFRKRIKQILYSDFAVQCLLFREKWGSDLIDKYGKEALAFRKKTCQTSKRLAYLGIRDILDNNRNNADELYRLLKGESWSLRKIVFLLLYNKLIHKTLLKKVIKKLK